jgi:hypothetical protein
MSGARATSGLLGSALVVASLALLVIAERVWVDGAVRSGLLGGAGLAFLAACSVRAVAWRRAQGDTRAVEGRLLASYAGVALSLLLYGASTRLTHEHATFALSLAWPTVLTSALAALFFMELAYARMPITASVELRRVRTAAHAGLTLALSLVFVISMAYVASVHDVRRDLSYFKTTLPSAGTAAMLSKLEGGAGKVTAILFWRKTDDVLAQVEPYFASLAKQSKHLRYEVLDAAMAPELTRKHKVSGNGSVVLLQGEGEAQKAEVMRIGNELLDARASLKKLDGLFQQHFAKLARPERTLRLTVGHGERNGKGADPAEGEGTEVMRAIAKRLNLAVEDLGLTEGLGSAVPEGASAVLVVGPQDRFLPEEAASLLAYVRKGGRLLLALDAVDDGLDPLLSGLGLVRKPGTLLSEKDHMQRTHTTSDRAIVFSNAYSAHPSVTTANRYRGEVATIFVRGVALDKAQATPGQSAPTVTFPLRTGGQFFRDVDADFTRDAEEPEETLNMIAAVTVPAQGTAPEGRALVVGDGDFVTDKLAGNNGNVMVFVDALAWLVGSEDLGAEVSSEEDIKIVHTREADKLWFYATTFGVPLPVAGLGLWMARRRRKRAERAS